MGSKFSFLAFQGGKNKNTVCEKKREKQYACKI